MADVVRRLACLLALATWWASAAAAAETDERVLRAAMVYNLLAFAEWPPEALPQPGRFSLCLVSDDGEVMRAFSRLASKQLKGRPLAVTMRRPLADLENCNAVYFDRIDDGLVADKLASLHGRAVVTIVADMQERTGAMIGLNLQEQRLGFSIDAAALRAVGLSLPARVLELARTVYR